MQTSHARVALQPPINQTLAALQGDWLVASISSLGISRVALGIPQWQSDGSAPQSQATPTTGMPREIRPQARAKCESRPFRTSSSASVTSTAPQAFHHATKGAAQATGQLNGTTRSTLPDCGGPGRDAWTRVSAAAASERGRTGQKAAVSRLSASGEQSTQDGSPSFDGPVPPSLGGRDIGVGDAGSSAGAGDRIGRDPGLRLGGSPFTNCTLPKLPVAAQTTAAAPSGREGTKLGWSAAWATLQQLHARGVPPTAARPPGRVQSVGVPPPRPRLR